MKYDKVQIFRNSNKNQKQIPEDIENRHTLDTACRHSSLDDLIYPSAVYKCKGDKYLLFFLQTFLIVRKQHRSQAFENKTLTEHLDL